MHDKLQITDRYDPCSQIRQFQNLIKVIIVVYGKNKMIAV